MASFPIVDAKVLVFDKNNQLIFRKGTDRFGRSYIQNIFKVGEEYTIKVKYDNEEKSFSFVFEPDMKGNCLL